MTVTKDSEALMYALRIQPADLDANRAGRLGPRQYTRVKEMRTMYLLGCVGIGLFFAIVCIEILDSRPFSPILALFAIGFVFILWAGMIVQTSYIHRDISEGFVKGVSGFITTFPFRRSSSSRNSSATPILIKVAGMSFRVSYRVRVALINDQTYAIYYLPRSLIVVGVERTESEELPVTKFLRKGHLQ